MMSVVMGAGLLGSICCLVLPPLADVILWISKAVLMFYEWNCRIMLKLPFARIVTGKPDTIQILLYLFLLILVYLLFRKGKGKLGMSALIFALTLLLGPWSPALRRAESHHDRRGSGGRDFDPDAGRTGLSGRRRKHIGRDAGKIHAGAVSGKQENPDVGLCPDFPWRYGSHQRDTGNAGAPGGGRRIRTLVLPEQHLWDEGLENLARTAKRAGTKVRTMKGGGSNPGQGRDRAFLSWPFRRIWRRTGKLKHP